MEPNYSIWLLIFFHLQNNLHLLVFAQDMPPVIEILEPQATPSLTPPNSIVINLKNSNLNTNVQWCQSGRCLVLKCTAMYPIEWIIGDGTEVKMKGEAIQTRNSARELPLSNLTEYTSILVLKHPNSEYTGWYNCQNFQNPLNKYTQKSLQYIYVKGDEETSLIKKRKAITTVVKGSTPTVIIPCRPNSPDTKLALYFQGTETANSREKNYDPTQGFTITLPEDQKLSRHGRLYECRAIHAKVVLDDYLLVRVIPEETVKLSPPQRIIQRDGSVYDSIGVSCESQDPLYSTIVVLNRNLNNGALKLGLTTNSESSTTYSCIIKEDQLSEFLDTTIVHTWVVPSFKRHQLSLKIDGPSRNHVECNSGVQGVIPMIQSCFCRSNSFCSEILGALTNPSTRGECEAVGRLCKTSEGVTESRDCGSSSGHCIISPITRTGFMLCLVENHPESEAFRSCQLDLVQVTAEAKRPMDVEKQGFSEDNECQKVGGLSSSGTAGRFWIKGSCEILATKGGYLSCFAHRINFTEGLRWSYSISQESPYVYSELAGDAGSTELAGLTFESRENPNNAELIVSTLTIKSIQKLQIKFKIRCRAMHVEATSSDDVELDIRVEDFQKTVFPTGTSEEESKSIDLNTEESLDCRAQGFPTPITTWYYRKDKGVDDWTPIHPQNSSSQFKNIAIGDPAAQVLYFKPFASSHEGIYKCELEQRLRELGLAEPGETVERIFIVEGFNWVNVLIVVVVILFIMGLTLALLAVFYHRRFRVEQFKAKQLMSARDIYVFVNGNVDAINPNLDLSEQAHLLPYNNSYEFPMENLRFDKQLGAGAYGTVVKAFAKNILPQEDESIVAVKTVLPSVDLMYLKALLIELKIMIHIGKHVNVVCLLGAVTANLKDGEVFIIVEYCRFGNLQHFLYKKRKNFVNQTQNGMINPLIQTFLYQNISPSPKSAPEAQVSLDHRSDSAIYSNSGQDTSGSIQPLWRNNMQGEYLENDVEILNTGHLVNFCLQIANGMDYLAEKKVIHGDLAARNILLAENKVVKIADFGLARQVYKDPNYIKSEACPLPVKWMAIESLKSLHFSSKSDVWAFGVVMWEMFTLGDNPYPGINVDEEFINKLESGFRLKHPPYATAEIYHVMTECWRQDPDDRPPFHTLANIFEEMIHKIDGSV